MGIVGTIILVAVVIFVVVLIYKSVHLIGPTEVGLVNKRFAFRKLPEDNPIAFHHEAGYQAELLMPGLRFKLWPVFAVQKYPWVQVPAGRDRRGDRPGRRAAAHRREVGGLQRVRQLLEPAPVHRQRRPEGRAAAGAPAGHAGADPPGGLPGDHQAAGLRPARCRPS